MEGYVKYPDELRHLFINGEKIHLLENGNFINSGYVPPDGLLIEISGTTQIGVEINKKIRIKRSISAVSEVKKFAKLDPTKIKNSQKQTAIALIIGVETYEKTNSKATFAERDAQYFADFAHYVLGVPKSNINLLIGEQADKGEFAFATKFWIQQNSVEHETDVFLFFSGHGLSTADGKDIFLLPYDGRPQVLNETAVKLRTILEDISRAKPKSINVFIDSCYSGPARDDTTLIDARPIAIVPDKHSTPEGINLFSASSGMELSRPFKEVKHGLFSYFLMTGLSGSADLNSDQKITNAELHEFVSSKVSKRSGFTQNPAFEGNPDEVIVDFKK